jgi:hypothetical protein
MNNNSADSTTPSVQNESTQLDLHISSTKTGLDILITVAQNGKILAWYQGITRLSVVFYYYEYELFLLVYELGIVCYSVSLGSMRIILN